MAMVLEGIRVLDWTVWQLGPVASSILGDLGADVIKIEERVGGDPGRGLIRIASAMMQTDLIRRSYFIEGNNRNKRGIAVDLRKEKGKEIVHKLVEKSDVLVQNFRMGVAERLGMDYNTLSSYNPRLIYAHASGWGPKGPDKDAPSFDYTGQARSGFMTLLGEPDMDPLIAQGGIADQTTAEMTALGVLAALLVRERTGVGQKVDVSLLGSMSFLVGQQIALQAIAGLTGSIRLSRKNVGNPLWNRYKCGDERWIVIAHLQSDRYWPGVCRAMGLEELQKDARFDTMDNRSAHNQELIAILDKMFATRTRDEWMKIFKENDLIASPVNTILELIEDPQAVANDYVTQFDHPVFGRTKMVGFPVVFSKTPCSIRREAPELGQHTEEILTEMLGYSWDDIAKLKEEEVI
jgi:crotonobetainyl-CoA:carnitine CoA-transferase CaiB-like acyl-CoA transferase